MSKKQDPPVKKNAFVHKLYTMLNDPKLSQLIWWSNNTSNTFALYPGKEFANALTGYFKHGNVASFVRQLHMYGFHKVSDPNNTSPTDKDTPPVWEFKHVSGKFKKDDESSLIYIKRRSSSNSSRNTYGTEQQIHNDYLLAPTSTEGYYPQQHYIQYYPIVQNVNMSNMSHQQQQAIHHQNHQKMSQNHQNMNQKLPQNMHPQNPPQQNMQQMMQHPQNPNMHPMQQQQPFPYQIQGPPHPYQYSQPIDYPQNLPHPYYVQQHDPYHGKRLPTAYNEPPQTLDDNKRHHSDQTLRSLTPSSYTTSQHYTPNLQFRKIWENSSHPTRSRNPSLLYDPLAPANTLQGHSVPSIPGTLAQNPNTILSRPMVIPNEEDSFSYARSDSHTSMASSTSIKLPPPSSIQRPSSLTYPHSPESSRNDSPVTTATTHLPRSVPNESSYSHIAYGVPTTSIPGSPSINRPNSAKKPSLVPISSAVVDKLRPSLIELHFGSGAGLKKPQNDSIGSHSSYNLIFSNGSSLSSTASVKRSSSFGSISSHPAVVDSNNKSSFSIGPHDPLPATSTEIEQPLATRWSENLQSNSVSQPAPNSYYGQHQFQSPRSSTGFNNDSNRTLVTSLTPPPSLTLKLNPLQASPIVRSSSSIPAFSSTVARSSTTSPLSKSFESKSMAKKVSVTSLLDDDVTPPQNGGHNKSALKSIIDESEPELASDESETKKRRLS
jgi:hypothetical protein